MPRHNAKRVLRKIVKNPWLQLLTGVVMLLSSVAGQQGALYSDLLHFRFRIHHGVNIMGIWQILQALPNLWDSVIWMFNRTLDD